MEVNDDFTEKPETSFIGEEKIFLNETMSPNMLPFNWIENSDLKSPQHSNSIDSKRHQHLKVTENL